MRKVNFTPGIELIVQDFNKLISLQEQNLNDQVLQNIFQKQPNVFFLDGFKCVRTSATTFDIKAGLGIVENLGAGPDESKYQYLVLETDDDYTVAPDTIDPRIDIVVVQPTLIDGETEQRRTKASEFSAIIQEDRTVTKKWQASIQIIEGVAAPVPVAPAVPAGYLKIAELYIDPSTVITNQAAISDLRNTFSSLWHDFTEEATPANIGTPVSGKRRVWFDTSGSLTIRDSNNNDFSFSALNQTNAFSILNNQSVAQDLTGFVVDNSLVENAVYYYRIYRKTDSAVKKESGYLVLNWDSEASSWDCEYQTITGSAGTEFSINVSGQVSYTSDDMSGSSYEGSLKISLVKRFDA